MILIKRILLNDHDVLMVNGNHFKAGRQIVICHPKKKESLRRKLDRLTDVSLILLSPDVDRPYNYLQEAFPLEDVPVMSLNDTESIAKWILHDYNSSLPSVKGLVLAGGKSQRMGENKANLHYHGRSQLEYACQLMTECGISPYISCRKEADDYPDQYDRVYDTFEGLGPFGGILSAFRSDPDAAWLVMACDQPLLTSKELQLLLDRRNPSKMATCYHNPETGFPEPLITLWEPRAYSRMLSFLSLGYSCPRKVLINSAIEEVRVKDTVFMKNANTLEERQELIKMISSDS